MQLCVSIIPHSLTRCLNNWHPQSPVCAGTVCVCPLCLLTAWWLHIVGRREAVSIRASALDSGGRWGFCMKRPSKEPQDGHCLPQLVGKESLKASPAQRGQFRLLPLVGDVAKNLQLSWICQNKYEKGEIKEFIGRSEFWSREFQLNVFIHVYLNIKWTVGASACSCWSHTVS